MRSKPIGLALEVINSANRETPADQVLREKLKAQRGLSRGEATEISRLVFAFYRWKGWLDPRDRYERRIEQALALSIRFSHEPQTFSDEDLVAHAVPVWIHEELEVNAEWIRALQTEPVLWLRARPGRGREVVRGIGNCKHGGPGALPDTLEYQGQVDLFRSREFQDGEFEVQDLSSQVVGIVCGPQAGETWWDACAGEGGKTLHLSALMGNTGMIWASDRAAWRLARLKRRAARAQAFNYRAASWDGGPNLPTRARFDGVLVDAPCTGVGTWHRNPHARWTTTPQDVRELAKIQADLLVRAAGSVKPGGRLIYSVCTPTRAETVEVASAFEAAVAGFDRVPIRNPLDPASAPEPELFLRTERWRGNGMYVAVWRRTA